MMCDGDLMLMLSRVSLWAGIGECVAGFAGEVA